MPPTELRSLRGGSLRDGIAQVEPLLAKIAAADMPQAAEETLAHLGRFESARHFAAWLGLTPTERSTGGRQRLGGISRAGDERPRRLLVVGAMAVIRHAGPGRETASPWPPGSLERRPRKPAAVAPADKMARTLWAMTVNGTAHRQRTPLPQAS